ncbi:hypothetical protein MG296_10665 [Flavobacteriaceae bacterium TK19130]|nr:hypothetical protein [Thermobacterium salinum]
MKVHIDLKELLEDFSEYINPEIEFIPRVEVNKMIDTFLSSNSLALGKPEPLAKNEQTENICMCKKSVAEPRNHLYCINCRKPIMPRLHTNM